SVDLGKLVDFCFVALMMRYAVVGIGHADSPVGSIAAFAAQHDRCDAGQIGLECDDLEVKHQLGVILKRIWNSDRAPQYWKFESGALGLGELDAALDIANGFQVIVELAPVARSESRLHARDFVGDGVQNAAIFPHAGQAYGGIGAVTI